MLKILIVEDDTQLATTLKYLVEDNPRYRVVATADDLESAVVGDFPEVDAARTALLETGAARAWMTGSGASMVGIFESAGAAVSAVDALGDRGIWARAVETIDGAAYRQALGLRD